MRILILHSSFSTRGGAEHYIDKLNSDLEVLGHDVKIISGDDARIPPYKRNQTRRKRYYRQLVDILGFCNRKVLTQVEEFNPDLIHLHNWARLRGRTIRKLSLKYPMLHTVHDYYLVDPSGICNQNYGLAIKIMVRMRIWCLQKYFRRVSFHFPAQRTMDNFVSYGGFKPKVHVIFPLNMTSLNPPTSEDRNRFAIGYMGQIEEHKGILQFCHEFVKANCQNLTLLIAGNGSQNSVIENLATEHPNIEFLGWQNKSEKEIFFERIGWLVFPSNWYENFSIACCEALERGIPILSSEICMPPMANSESLVLYGTRSIFHNASEALHFLSNISNSTYLKYSNSAKESISNFEDSYERENAYQETVQIWKGL